MTVRAGIDLSMSSPVIVTHDDRLPLTFENCRIFSYGNYSYCKQLEGQHSNINIMKQPKWDHNLERFQRIAQWAASVAQLCGVNKACIENYAYNATGNSYDIGELGGIVKLELFKRSIPICVIEPTRVKKLFAGRGSAPKGSTEKEMMYEAFTNLTKVDLTKTINLQVAYTKEKDHKKINETPWAVKPLDDIADAFAVLTCHPDFEEIKV